MEHIQPVNDTRALLGEGALWYDGRLYWIDVVGQRIYTYEPKTNTERYISCDAVIGTVVPRARGGLVAALQTGFYFVNETEGRFTPVVDPERDKPDNRFNDGKCDPAGRLWAGTMHVSGSKPSGSLYALDVDGQVHKKLEGTTISNGICWSLNKQTMYYIDSPTRHVAAFDYDVTTGTIRNRRIIVRIPESDGIPDGMTIDERGHLWIALWGGNAVVCYDPHTGQRLQTVSLPVSLVTSCAFGGDDLADLYITSARSDLSEEELESEPYAGGLFRVRVGVRGVPAFAYEG